MISVEEFLQEKNLNTKTNFLLEEAVREYLLLNRKWSTYEVGDIRDVNPSEYTLDTSKEAIYKREFLEDCFSDNNKGWKNGNLKKLTTLNKIDGTDLYKTTS